MNKLISIYIINNFLFTYIYVQIIKKNTTFKIQ